MKCNLIWKFIVVITILLASGCASDPETIQQLSMDANNTITETNIKVADSAVARTVVNGNKYIAYAAAVKGSAGTTDITYEDSVKVIEISGGGLPAPMIIKTTESRPIIKVTNAYAVKPPPDHEKDHAMWRFGEKAFKYTVGGILGWKGLDVLGDIVDEGYANSGGTQNYHGDYAPANSNNDIRGQSTFSPEGDISYNINPESEEDEIIPEIPEFPFGKF